MRPPRPLLLAALLAPLLAATPARASDGDGPRLFTGLGAAWFALSSGPARDDAMGVALELRLAGRAAPRAGWALTFTWGLTDWDRAGEWIDAGDRAGSWTTDRFADVEAWVRRGEDDNTVGLRLLGAMVADLFLVGTYAAVPFCYVGSVGGATSHLQIDAVGTFHAASGPHDVWVELGAGAATLPSLIADWRTAVGPVGGIGAQVGSLRLGARVLWSPPALNTASHGATVLTGAFTATLVR